MEMGSMKIMMAGNGETDDTDKRLTTMTSEWKRKLDSVTDWIAGQSPTTLCNDNIIIGKGATKLNGISHQNQKMRRLIERTGHLEQDDNLESKMAAAAAAAAAAVVVADAPMDLSKRASNQKVIGNIHIDNDDEPLNLSVNGNGTVNHPRLSNANGDIGNNHMKKRVRLEEMVSYIRQCSSEQISETCSNPHRRKLTTPCKGHQMTTTLFKPKKSFSKEHFSDRNNSSQATLATYPVLRKQLLDSSVDATTKDDDNDNDNNDNNDNGVDNDDDDDDDDPDAHHDDVDEDDPDVLRRQLRLLRTAPPNGSLPWTAYAYYANLLQELQGSLTNLSNSSSGAGQLIQHQNINATVSGGHSMSPPSMSDDNGVPTPIICNQTTTTTTTSVDVDGNVAGSYRKRALRALTGKHVKHGTGASPATLLTLRQKIEQRRGQQPHVPQANLTQRHQKNGKVSPRKKIS